jgi:hypothetical protein
MSEGLMTLERQKAAYAKQLRGLEARRKNLYLHDVMVVSDQDHFPTTDDIDEQIKDVKAALAMF